MYAPDFSGRIIVPDHMSVCCFLVPRRCRNFAVLVWSLFPAQGRECPAG